MVAKSGFSANSPLLPLEALLGRVCQVQLWMERCKRGPAFPPGLTPDTNPITNGHGNTKRCTSTNSDTDPRLFNPYRKQRL
jgi:hypothetical protein